MTVERWGLNLTASIYSDFVKKSMCAAGNFSRRLRISGEARRISPSELNRMIRMFCGSLMRHGETYYFFDGIARNGTWGQGEFPRSPHLIITFQKSKLRQNRALSFLNVFGGLHREKNNYLHPAFVTRTFPFPAQSIPRRNLRRRFRTLRFTFSSAPRKKLCFKNER